MKKQALVIISLIFFPCLIKSQDKLYPDKFPLGDVTLFSSPFKNAQDHNIQTLLQYDVDRLLEPYLTEAGLTPKGSPYENWSGLAGHVGGHYLSALAIHYAATGDSACKARMDYMLAEFKACQDANGDGYIGGVPDSKLLWSSLKEGQFTLYNSCWVPWYNVHKTYAGLRDAWLYGSSDSAKTMFLKLCDWGIDIISGLSDAQMQTMLTKEFGGMNEVYADAYQMTGEIKYLNTAKRFTHNLIFNSLSAGIDNLDNLHANTQIPKVIGFERIANTDAAATNYAAAAGFFWETVVQNRSLALGGNSRSEHFPSAADCGDYTTTREGPESCNTYNMLKLTEFLFSVDPQVKYIDFYERALYNHILSTRHPEHGGYVYFTSARPRHYRVYSAPNQAMWCCVGTGMENHGKYGQFIYTHKGDDSLFVNLFIPSKLNWKQKGVEITQETNFPDADSTVLTIHTSSASQFKLFMRHPSWVTSEGFKVIVNGDTIVQNNVPGTFVNIDRTWNNGDKTILFVPMHNTFEELPNVSDYIALLHGPILLGAKTGTENLDGIIADDGRWSHIASGSMEPLYSAPILVGDRDSIVNKLQPVEGETLKFTAPGLFASQPDYQPVEFEPFFRIHNARYMMYWMNLTQHEFDSVLPILEALEQAALELDSRTIDEIATGQQQPEADHSVTGSNTSTGIYNDEFFRYAHNGGYFSYQMTTGGLTGLTLMARYWGNETGLRTFDILIDNVVIATENISGKWKVNEFVNVEYPIPVSLLEGKEIITVRFQAKPLNTAGGVFYLRLLKPLEVSVDANTDGTRNNPAVFYNNGSLYLTALPDSLSRFHLYSQQGILLNSGTLLTGEVRINMDQFPVGLYILLYHSHGISKSYKVIHL